MFFFVRPKVGFSCLAAWAWFAAGCAEYEQLGEVSRAELEGWGPAAPVDLPDEPPRPGETVTQARTRALTAYAHDLAAAWDPALAESLRRRGTEPSSLNEHYQIRVEGGSCFSENHHLGTDYDIATDDDLQKMKRQVEMAVEFLAQFHDDANGYPNRFFDTVALCPYRRVDGHLVLRGRTLYVGVPYRWGSIRPVNAFELRETWDRGDHLESGLAELKRIWPLLNPVGAARMTLRATIADSAQALRGRLRELLAESERDLSEGALREEVRAIVSDNVVAGYQEPGGVTLVEKTQEQLRELSREQLRALVTAWADYLEKADRWEGMTEAVLATHEATARNTYDIDIEQRGLVVVGNFHDICIQISAFLPRNRQFVRYVTIEKLDRTVRVRQWGLVAVYTMDHVEVNLAVHAERSLETAGLEHALRRLGLGAVD